MIKTGVVSQVDYRSNSGVLIERKTRQEYFFFIEECSELELPREGDTVTFVKSKEFVTSNVAEHIMPSGAYKKLG